MRTVEQFVHFLVLPLRLEQNIDKTCEKHNIGSKIKTKTGCVVHKLYFLQYTYSIWAKQMFLHITDPRHYLLA